MDFKRIFRKIDRDSDYVITAQDLEAYAKRFNLTQKFINNWLLIFDDDEDEVVSWNDVEDCILKYGGANSVTCKHLAKILKPNNFRTNPGDESLTNEEDSSEDEDYEEDRERPIVSDIKPSYNKVGLENVTNEATEQDLSVDLPPEVIMMACDVSTKQKLEVICACRAYYLRSKNLKYLSKNHFPKFGYTSIVEEDETGSVSDADSTFEDPIERKSQNNNPVKEESFLDKIKDSAKSVRNKIYRRASSKQLEKIFSNLKPSSTEAARELELCEVATVRLTNHLQKIYGGNWKVVLNPNPGATINHHTEGLIFFKFKGTYFNHAILIWKGYQSDEKFLTKVHKFCCCQNNYF